MSTVIHRRTDENPRWFTHKGRTYDVYNNGPAWGWEVVDQDAGRRVADGLDTLAQVRALVNSGGLDGER